MHTNYSDGDIPPIELIRKVKEQGVEAIAITDHDNFRAYEKVKKEAEDLGLILIQGSEITAEKYHILGLGLNFYDKKFIEFLEHSRELQLNNTKRTIKNLQEIGLEINFQEVENAFPIGARIGCFNTILYLARNEKFKEYFLERRIEFELPKINKFVRKYKNEEESVTPEEAIREVHRVGGIAIIAHPAKDIGDFTKQEHIRELENLLKIGLDGLEIQPNYMETGYRNYLNYASENNLIITYGSDYHENLKDKRPLLRKGENMVSDELVNRLRN